MGHRHRHYCARSGLGGAAERQMQEGELPVRNWELTGARTFMVGAAAGAVVSPSRQPPRWSPVVIKNELIVLTILETSISFYVRKRDLALKSSLILPRYGLGRRVHPMWRSGVSIQYSVGTIHTNPFSTPVRQRFKISTLERLVPINAYE